MDERMLVHDNHIMAATIYYIRDFFKEKDGWPLKHYHLTWFSQIRSNDVEWNKKLGEGHVFSTPAMVQCHQPLVQKWLFFERLFRHKMSQKGPSDTCLKFGPWLLKVVQRTSYRLCDMGHAPFDTNHVSFKHWQLLHYDMVIFSAW